ncbi:MAG: MarR family transcriptional regulator [Candidatus Thiodiazotropha sp.]|jgi:DNA-binding MarR family transcriptional regulator
MNQHATQPDMPMGIAYLVGHLERLVRRRLREVISPLGLTIQQYTALSVLNARGRLSNAQLAERSLITPQSANELVKTMEKRGWIERTADPSHKRIIHLYLTTPGKDVLNNAHRAAAAFEEEMLHEIGNAERQQYRDFLSTSIHTLSRTSIDLLTP